MRQTRILSKHRLKWWRWLLMLGAVGLMAAAALSPAAVLNLLARVQRYDVNKDVPYADGARHRLDIYRPRGSNAAPVLVFFYGGSWQTGSKELYLFLAATLAARGYVVVVPDYRVYPEVKFPAFLQDGAEAVRWARDNAATYGGDPTRIFLVGHSAGAYIAAMLALDNEWLADVGLDPHRDLAGLIGVSGPYDFRPIKDETLKVIFKGSNRVQTQPVAFSEGQKPPTLLLTGSDDHAVNPKNSRSLAEHLRSSGNAATDLVYRRFGHISILLAFAPFVARLLPVLDDVDAFVAAARPTAENRPMAAVGSP